MDHEAVCRARKRSLVAALAAAVLPVVLLAALPGAFALDAVTSDPVTSEAVTTDVVEVVETVEEQAETVVETVVEIVDPSPSPSPSPSPTPSQAPQPTTDRSSGSPPEEAPTPPASPAPRRAPAEPVSAASAPQGSPVTAVELPGEPEEPVEEVAPKVLPEHVYRQIVDASGPRLQPVSLPDAVPVLAAARSTQTVLDVLGRIDAPAGTIARILAPFPVAGLATYHPGEGTSAVVVAASGTAVVAAADGTISKLDGGSLSLVGGDGTTYTYAGLERTNRMLAPGRAVAKGELLGHTGGSSAQVVFGIVNRDGVPVPAVPYLDRWVDQALQAAEALAAAHDGVYTPQAAPPEGAEVAVDVAPPAAEDARKAGVSGQVRPDLTTSSEPSPAGPLLLAMALALLWFRAYRLRRPGPDRTNQGFLDLPPYGGGA